jgi:polyhydroxyalkanoate synthesis regulator phasin
MALDPITAIANAVDSVSMTIGEVIRNYADPEKVRQRKIRKLNEKIEKLEKKLREIMGYGK